MQYCRVNNGNIVSGPMPLPKTFKNMSGFDKDPENAESYGFLPALVTKPAIPTGHKRGNRIVEIGDIVTITWEVVPMSPEEIFTRDFRIWKQSMEVLSLAMPDFMEFHIRGDHGGTVASPAIQTLYDEKVALRDSEPVEP